MRAIAIVALCFTVALPQPPHPVKGRKNIILGGIESIGVGLGLLHQKKILRSLVQLAGFSMMSPIPTSWDYVFANKPSVWLLVTLRDGSQVGGLWGRDSFASSDQKERDLYIERVFKVAEDGQWKEIPRSSGILIQGEDIRHIEFYEV